MYWIILGVAILIICGVTIALCDSAKRADKNSDDSYNILHRGDSDGNN